MTAAIKSIQVNLCSLKIKEITKGTLARIELDPSKIIQIIS